MTERSRLEGAAVLGLVKAATGLYEWHRVADIIEDVGSALRIVHGEWSGLEVEEARDLHKVWVSSSLSLEEYEAVVSAEEEAGSELITVLNDSYPSNLREIYNRPPFLFVRGALTDSDTESIAVVGTRNASPEGLSQARRLAQGLSARGVTVLSGMALGIDTAAHLSALDSGGRTIAVMGTGIRRTYPPANADLAVRIEHHGALVSQFWPDAPPTKYSFPMRNVVTSGLSLGTVVVEASSKSGARNQARLALEHGKAVFFVRSLVAQEEWAKDYIERRGAQVIEDVDDVLDWIDRQIALPAVQQLKLA